MASHIAGGEGGIVVVVESEWVAFAHRSLGASFRASDGRDELGMSYASGTTAAAPLAAAENKAVRSSLPKGPDVRSCSLITIAR